MFELEINVQGRFTKFPGKESVIDRLNNGHEVKLRIERDLDGQIILVDSITDEPAGCIPPNPSYLDKYEVLKKIIDSGKSQFVKVHAIESCHNNKHYRAKICYQS